MQPPAEPEQPDSAPSGDTTDNSPFGPSTTGPRETPKDGESTVVVPEPKPLTGCLLTPLLFVGVLVLQFVVAIPVIIVMVVGGGISGLSQNDVKELLPAVLIPATTFSLVPASLAIVFLAYRSEAPRRMCWRSCSGYQWFLALLCVVPLQVLGSEIINWSMELKHYLGLHRFIDFSAMVEALGTLPVPVMLLGACLFPGVGEELMFRGIIGRGLLGQLGWFWGVVLTSLMFGMVHVEPVQASGAVAIGVGLHFLLITTRSLMVPMVVHTANNTMALLMSRYGKAVPVPGLNVDPGGDDILHTPMILLLPSALALGLTFFLLYRTRTRWRLPDGRLWSPGYASVEIPDPKLGCLPSGESPSMASTALLLAAQAGLFAALVYAAWTHAAP